MRLALFAAIAAALISTPADARQARQVGQVRCTAAACAVVGYGSRPRAWCGWFARQMVGADPGPVFNLARAWAHWGRPARPGVGAMVVWTHHVGKITGRTPDGLWIVKSGNDGHEVRERPRSIRGAIAFRVE